MGFTQNEESLLTIKIYEHILKKECQLFTEEQKFQIIDRLVKHRLKLLTINERELFVNSNKILKSKKRDSRWLQILKTVFSNDLKPSHTSPDCLANDNVEKSGHLFQNTRGFPSFELDNLQWCESCHSIIWNFKNYLMCSHCHISLHYSCLSCYAKECVHKVYDVTFFLFFILNIFSVIKKFQS